MLQVADAFHKAVTPRQKYFTSLCVMLMCQPSRNSELSGLTINSLQKSSKGRWYLMWNPAKGGDPVRKWVPKLIEDVVQQAFNRLIDISVPARDAVKFAYENPNTFMIHEQCITPHNFSQEEPLTYNQFAKALGLKTGKAVDGTTFNWRTTSNTKWIKNLINKKNGASDWYKDLLKGNSILPTNEIVTKGSNKSTGIEIKFPNYSDLRSVIDDEYITQDFPNYGDIKLWDCITLVRDYEFHKDFAAKPFSWVMVTHGAISDAIGSERPSGGGYIESIFDELGITDEDGIRLQLNTHQPRHWLNTKLALAGEDDWLIAKWSGRADIKQNKAYDGRTQEQKSRLTKRIGHVRSGAELMPVSQAHELLAPYTSDSPPPPMVLT